MEKKLTKQVVVQLPIVPNHILIDEDMTLHVSEFTEKELRALGKAWTEALVEKGKIKKDKNL